MTEELIGWLDHSIDGGMSLEREPACPCPRDHPFLYSDGACDAALRRLGVVTFAAIDTSRQLSERQRTIRRQRGVAAR